MVPSTLPGCGPQAAPVPVHSQNLFCAPCRTGPRFGRLFIKVMAAPHFIPAPATKQIFASMKPFYGCDEDKVKQAPRIRHATNTDRTIRTTGDRS
jgi:hypothetical protein